MHSKILLIFIVCTQVFAAPGNTYPFHDTSLSVSRRVEDLVSRLTIREKIEQLGNRAPEIPRLGIASCNYWNEACHGVLRLDATSFPHVIGLSSTWDTVLIHSIATAISDEARLLHSQGKVGLHFFTPTMNLGRDPRWGRNEETFGEDVFLTKKMAVNFIRGLQGTHPRYLKVAATAKHFVCNNSEQLRRKFSSQVDERSLREFYFPAFKASIDAGVASVMSAYNGLNGIPCSANKWLLKDILRDEWGFEGYVVSDCNAIDFLTTEHRFTINPTEAAAVAVKAGCDLECGSIYQQYLELALANRMWNIPETTLDTALKRIFRSRFLLGEFDPPEMVPYNDIPASLFNSDAHHELSLTAARESIVLLKNDESFLPLDSGSIHSIALIGPFANRCELGGYSGIPTTKVTPLRGVINYLGTGWKNRVHYTRGCGETGEPDQAAIDKAVMAAVKSDVVILFLGTGPANAREEYDFDYTSLPGGQQALAEAVLSANQNTVVVFITGNPLPVPWYDKHFPALLTAWYAGPFQGVAIADVLFGRYNPGGKLTQTWYAQKEDLPPLEDYSLFSNRTYMFFEGTPLYHFGHGLSYTTFSYDNLSVSPRTFSPADTVAVTVDITNTGTVTGDEIAQLYIRDNHATVKVPEKQLKGFERVSLAPLETKSVTFTIPGSEFSFWDAAADQFIVEPGVFAIMVGTSSDSILLEDRITATSDLYKSRETQSKRIYLAKKGTSVYTLVTNAPTKYTIDIVRIDGKRVFSKSVHVNSNYRLPPLPAGIYLTNITEKSRLKTMKLLVTD